MPGGHYIAVGSRKVVLLTLEQRKELSFKWQTVEPPRGWQAVGRGGGNNFRFAETDERVKNKL